MAQKKSSSSIRMSIVIPVYNESDYIEDCIKCLDAQTAPKKAFEAIIVDDGSHDDSLEKCRQIAKTHPHIKVISQNNKGVSAARNAGIEMASGDYIMFLDPNDSITPNTVSCLVETFDSLGDSTDVITYGLLLRFMEIDEAERHKREKWLPETGLYYLEEAPYIAQSSMNVCIRNRHADNIMFDTTLQMGGDQLFITENLKRKATIGYCAEAEYIYSRDLFAASRQLENPLYSYDGMITFFKHLLAIAEENIFMRRYVQCLLLHEVDERMTSNGLFARHLAGAEREKADRELFNIMSAIPHEEYARNPYLDVFRKAYLLKTFKFPNSETEIRYVNNHSLVAFGDEYVWMTAKPRITIERCRYYDSKLSMRGRLGGATMLFEEKPELVVSYGKTKCKVELTPSSYRYTSKKMPMLVTKAWSFSCEFDLKKAVKGSSIKFSATIGGRRIPSLEVVNTPFVHNSRLINKTRCFPGLEVDTRENELALFPRSPLEQHKTALNAARHNISLTSARRKAAAYCKKHAGSRMWMYVDLPSSRAEGNALVAMLHDLNEEDGIERYYISEFAGDLTKVHPILEGRVLEPNSDEHRFLSLRAEIVVCSYLERSTFSPFVYEEYSDYADFAADQRRVYVQHGILHAKIPWYFSFDRLHIDAEVISTTMEEHALLDTYGFPEEAIIRSGAPRLDLIGFGSVRANKRILFVPSWRSYLVEGNAENRTGSDDILISSSFYKSVMDFVQLVSESCLLEERGYTLEIKLHPNFKCYEHLFEFESPSISLAPDNINEQDYPIVITDFSSYVYDFIYAGSDIVYFLPDHAEFDAGLNHYSELEVPLDQAYGPYCETPDQLLEEIEKLVSGDADTNVYRQRMESLFLHTDGKNCDRLYKALKKMADDLHADA